MNAINTYPLITEPAAQTSAVDLYPDLADWTWHSAVLKPQIQYREIAMKNLRAKGYRVMLPMCMEQVHVRGVGFEDRASPLLGRYLFVGVAPRQDSWAIRRTPGVQHMTLDRHRAPLKVPHPALAAIVARMDPESGVIDLRPPARVRQQPSGYVVGDAVRIEAGPFSGFDGLFQEDQGARCRVLVEIFGRPTPVVVPAKGLSLSA